MILPDLYILVGCGGRCPLSTRLCLLIRSAGVSALPPCLLLKYVIVPAITDDDFGKFGLEVLVDNNYISGSLFL
jgi:hypothetical protein